MHPNPQHFDARSPFARAQLAVEGPEPTWPEPTPDEWLWALGVGVQLYVSTTTPHKPSKAKMDAIVKTLEAMLPSMDETQRVDFVQALQHAKGRLDQHQPVCAQTPPRTRHVDPQRRRTRHHRTPTSAHDIARHTRIARRTARRQTGDTDMDLRNTHTHRHARL